MIKRLVLLILILLLFLTSCSSHSSDNSAPSQDLDDDDDDNDDNDDTAGDDDDDDNDDDNDDDTMAIDWPACDSYGAPTLVGLVQSPELVELSGLAVSHKNPGVLWAINDSGNGPFIYAFAPDGTDLGRVRLQGRALNIDWEDLAIGPCGLDECLYIADIGDNPEARFTKYLFRIVEPEVDPSAPFGHIELGGWERLSYRYPDGKPDCETMAVHPNGDIYFVSKLRPGGEGGFYHWPDPVPNKLTTLTRLGTFDLVIGGDPQLATGGDIHRNGDRLLVRVYDGAFEWRIPRGNPFEEVLAATQMEVPAAIEHQGESIAYDPASGGYYHVSELSSGYPDIYFISCETP